MTICVRCKISILFNNCYHFKQITSFMGANYYIKRGNYFYIKLYRLSIYVLYFPYIFCYTLVFFIFKENSMQF